MIYNKQQEDNWIQQLNQSNDGLQKAKNIVDSFEQEIQTHKRNPYAWVFFGSDVAIGKQTVEKFICEIASKNCKNGIPRSDRYYQQCLLNKQLWECVGYNFVYRVCWCDTYYVGYCDFEWKRVQ